MNEQGEVNVWDPVAGHSVNVPDHAMNREQEITAEEARRQHLNDEIDRDELPLVLSSDMSADPSEGVQGSYSAVVEEDCSECPSELAVRNEAHTLAGVGYCECLLCGYTLGEW